MSPFLPRRNGIPENFTWLQRATDIDSTVSSRRRDNTGAEHLRRWTRSASSYETDLPVHTSATFINLGMHAVNKPDQVTAVLSRPVCRNGACRRIPLRAVCGLVMCSLPISLNIVESLYTIVETNFIVQQ